MEKINNIQSYCIKAIRILFKGFIIFFITLLILEISYRYYWIDFYKTEFSVLNNIQEKKKSQKKILIFGDSFSAQEISYARILRDSSKYQVINLSVPGSCVKQHELYAPKKIKEIDPDVIIFQLYVGNDLLDIHHPINWSKNSILKNTYWWIKDHFLFIGYLNYKIAQINAIKGERTQFKPVVESEFAPNKYDNRTRSYLAADPQYIEKMVQLTEERTDDFNSLLESYKNIISELSFQKKVYFLIIPDATQTSEIVLKQYESMGMRLNDRKSFSNTDYPFNLRLKKEFHSAKIIDPLAAFKEFQKNGKNLYYKNDPHLNETGQYLLYTIVKKEIEN